MHDLDITKKISVVIPTYNEEKTIIEIVLKVQNSLSKLKFDDYEIIIIDDCSIDNTREMLKKFEKDKKIKLLFHKKNMGKGAALNTGFKNITGDFVIIQDSDLEYDPEDFEKLLLPFFEANADVVYGSRFIGGGKYIRIHFFWHFIANKILTFFSNVFTNLNLTDMETGYKAFKFSAIKSISITEKSFGVEPEITIKLAKKKLKFFEVAISYNGRSYEEGKKITLFDAFTAIYCIIKYGLGFK